jgi:transposase
MRQRRETVEHRFATLKMRMGATSDEAPAESRHRDGTARARLYSRRVMNIIGVQPLLAVMRA